MANSTRRQALTKETVNIKFLPNTIINFHAVYNTNWMEKVLRLLKNNYHIIPIQEVEKFYYDDHKINNVCHITFDDGDLSFYSKVFPLLKKYNIPASIYVSPLMAREQKNFWFQEIRGYDNKKLHQIIKSDSHENGSKETNAPLWAIFKSMTLSHIWQVINQYQEETGTPTKPCMNMNQKQFLELHESELVAIGAHTQNHPILKNETDEKAFAEITDSINQLGDLLCTDIKHFAYPNGIPNIDFDQREVNILKNAGVRLAFSIENNTINPNDNPLSIPRNGISKGNTSFIIAKLIAGKRWDWIKKLIKKNQITFLRS